MSKKRGKRKSSIGFADKFLKISAWSGILFLILCILGLILPFFITINSIVLLSLKVILGILLILFLYGFFVLGKKHHNGFLTTMVVLLILFILIYLATLIGFINPMMKNISEKIDSLGVDFNNISEGQAVLVLENALPLLTPLFGVVVLCLYVYTVLMILFGASLLDLRYDEVKYAKSAGFLSIIGGATTFLGIGYLFLLASFILQIIILFRN